MLNKLFVDNVHFTIRKGENGRTWNLLTPLASLVDPCALCWDFYLLVSQEITSEKLWPHRKCQCPLPRKTLCGWIAASGFLTTIHLLWRTALSCHCQYTYLIKPVTISCSQTSTRNLPVLERSCVQLTSWPKCAFAQVNKCSRGLFPVARDDASKRCQSGAGPEWRREWGGGAGAGDRGVPLHPGSPVPHSPAGQLLCSAPAPAATLPAKTPRARARPRTKRQLNPIYSTSFWQDLSPWRLRITIDRQTKDFWIFILISIPQK